MGPKKNMKMGQVLFINEYSFSNFRILKYANRLLLKKNEGCKSTLPKPDNLI